MIVLILTAAPSSLRGALTRWLMEVDTGVYVGHLSARVRTQLWELVRENIGSGRALMIESANNEQHLQVTSCGFDRQAIDMDGMTVMLTPDHPRAATHLPGATKPPSEGWSIAGRRRRFRSYGERVARSIGSGSS